MRGRFVTIRFRLTAWHALALTLTLSGFAATIYVLVRAQLLRHHDASLRRTATAVEAVLREHDDCASLTPEQVARLDEIGRLVLLHDVDGAGRILYRSPDTRALRLPPEVAMAKNDADRAEWFETHETGSGLLRILSRPYRSHAGRAGIIRVMDLLGDVEEPLGALRLGLLVVTPLAILLSSAGGYWLARRALAPVDRVTRLAREIEAGRLDSRLPEPRVRDEIGRLVDTLNEMIGRLEDSFGTLRRFTADASHELRGPLATMRGTLDVVLARPREPTEYRAALTSLGEEVDRLRAIVDDLLLLARADAGHVPLEREPLRLDELVAGVAESLQTTAEQRGVQLELDGVEPVTAFGDERWLRQLCFNVLDNAIKFTAGHGTAPRVGIGARRDGDSAVLTVSDTGPGIRDDALDHVFERFYRVDDARGRERTGGFGLGLAISAWIAQAHGGTLTAANRESGGAVFTLRLPARL